MHIASLPQSAQTISVNSHVQAKQSDRLSCYQSFANTISSLRATVSKLTCWKKCFDPQSPAASISAQIPLLKMPAPLQAEVIQSANERTLKRYGEETIKTAKKWGTDDFASVEIILQCLPRGLVPPDDPSKIYLFRNQKTTSKNIDLEKCLVRNNPAAEALINDEHLLDIRPTRDQIAILEAREKHLPIPLVLQATKKMAGISHADSHQITKVVTPAKTTKNASGIQGVLPHGGINFLVSTQANIENKYGQNKPHLIHLRVSLKSILDMGGKIYKDIGAAVWHAVIVELPLSIDGIPYLDMSNMTPDDNSCE